MLGGNKRLSVTCEITEPLPTDPYAKHGGFIHWGFDHGDRYDDVEWERERRR